MAKHTCPVCNGMTKIEESDTKPCPYCEGLGGFEDMKAIELLILNYGWIDGAHHKQWVLDQILQIASENYEQLFENDDFAAGWDTGIAP